MLMMQALSGGWVSGGLRGEGSGEWGGGDVQACAYEDAGEDAFLGGCGAEFPEERDGQADDQEIEDAVDGPRNEEQSIGVHTISGSSRIPEYVYWLASVKYQPMLAYRRLVGDSYHGNIQTSSVPIPNAITRPHAANSGSLSCETGKIRL